MTLVFGILYGMIFGALLYKGLTEPIDDLSRDDANRRRFMAPVRSFHSHTDSRERPHDHG